MTRVIREHLKDFIAILVLFVLGLVTTFIILIGQGVTFPSWVPALGSESFELKAEFTSAQAITPGQGQTVNLNGVTIGEISRVEVEDGTAIVTMDVRSEYAPLIRTDASFLPRPRSGLQDMVIEIDPGTAEESIPEDSTVPQTQTLTQVQSDEVLATLDADTRAYLKLLINDAGQGLAGNGVAFSQGLRQFEPFARNVAEINGLLSQRRKSIARSIHNFGLLSDALADNDQTLAQFIDSSNAVLGSFANQEDAIRASLQELPATLTATLDALESSDEFALELTPALRDIRPAARAFGPAQEALQPFFTETVGPIKNQIRPFTRQVQKPFKHLNQLSKPLGQAAKGLNTGFTDLNTLLNMLAYNPPGSSEEGYLFWLTWLNHNANSNFLAQDAAGPLRRGIVLLSCQTARLVDGVVERSRFLKTLQQLSNTPLASQIC